MGKGAPAAWHLRGTVDTLARLACKTAPLSPQVKGSPWWPAVVCPDANGHTQRGRQYHVAFFGEDQTEGYCMPDNMCNFELNLGNFNASMTARGSRKRQAAIDDALAELQRREHAQASLTATRSTASSRSPAVPYMVRQCQLMLGL